MANQVLYGFHSLADVFSRRVTEVGEELVSNAIRETIAEHNRQMDALMGLLVRRTTSFQINFKTANAHRLQPLDEWGRALPVKLAGMYQLAFPLYMAGSAWGANFISRQKMTVGEANDVTSQMITADARWLRDNILAALYTNVNRTFSDPEHGALVVKPLANGDTDTYSIISGSEMPATDTHYSAQANAIDDANNPFPGIHDELVEHPENGDRVIAMVPTGLRASIEGLATFFAAPDPNISLGIASDRLVGSFGEPVPGEVFGYADGVWVSEWRALPADYIIAINVGGEAPLAMREDEEEQLRGFAQIATREDHPYWEAQYMRRAGFGAWNRVGALVHRVGNGAYAIPTGYTAPLP
jgi:hypothetical protein